MKIRSHCESYIFIRHLFIKIGLGVLISQRIKIGLFVQTNNFLPLTILAHFPSFQIVSKDHSANH